jgi:squalene-associated FAD-dependent desaturase
MRRVHVIGAGLAGLAAALKLAGHGRETVVHEAAPHAGGRCRSFADAQLGCRIDNGNHLVLAGNPAVRRHVARIGAADSLAGPSAVLFPFVDLASGKRWTIRWERGRVPWWLLSASRRVPGTRLGAYLEAFRLTRAEAGATIGEVVDTSGPLFRQLLDPLARAVMNTAAPEASAALFGVVLKETFGRGAEATRPLVARDGLSESFVEPALQTLAREGAALRLGSRLRALRLAGDRCVGLAFGDGPLELAADDRVVLALPAAQAAALLPELTVPERHHAIVNGHFRIDPPVDLPDGAVLLGILGGTAEWLFARGGIVSVTVSAADALAEKDAAAIAVRLWADVARALDLPAAPLPPHRIVKEKRATFSQTPAEVRRRPGPQTRIGNLVLAGDWTDTGLPATIEGALRSGERAAEVILTAH